MVEAFLNGLASTGVCIYVHVTARVKPTVPPQVARLISTVKTCSRKFLFAMLAIPPKSGFPLHQNKMTGWILNSYVKFSPF